MARKPIQHNLPTLEQDDYQHIVSVFKSRWIAEGAHVRALEASVSKYIGQKYAKAVSSGTAALHLALLALNVQKGDEVILSTYVCSAVLNAVHYVGAIPKLADIDEKNLGVSTASVRRLLSAKTKAIVVNHAFGFPASIEKIRSFGIPIVEDCAQAYGSQIGGQPLGSFGDISIFSFFATKMFTTGYGGMILTGNPKCAAIIRDLTNFDKRSDYKVRFNYGLSDLSAALGASQLKKISRWIQIRRTIALKYAKSLQNRDLFFWMGNQNEQPNFYRFILGNAEPYSKHIKHLSKMNIQAISPLQPYQLLHRYLKLDNKKFPVAEAVSRSVVSVPIYPGLSHSQIIRIDKALQTL